MDIEVPKNQWKDKLQGFSNQHKGWPARVSESSLSSPRFDSDYWPLLAVSCDDVGGETVVSIVVERIGDPASTHVVSEPCELHIKRTDDDDADLGIEIISRDGTQTVLELEVPAA